MKALVTGGGTRLGQFTAVALAERGYDILIHYYTNKAGAKDTAKIVKEQGREAEIIQADFRNNNAPYELTQQINSLDLLVNNASFYPSPEKKIAPNDLFSETMDSWNLSMTVNAKTPFFLIQALSPILSKSSDGQIINVLDMSVTKPFLSRAAHSISKSALAAITILAAETLYPEVRVNAVQWGNIIPSDLESDFIDPYKENISEALNSIFYLLDNTEANGEVVKGKITI